MVFLWASFSGDVFVVMFLWWCFWCGVVLVVAFLW